MKQINTILIVDDEPGARNILEALLLREGHHLEFASCGKDALERVQNITPSLVLLDVMMPEMDGFEVCRRLRATPTLAEVPIIMITALDDRESRLEGIRAGADDFLSKPFDREELRARIRTILRLNRYRRLHAERAKFEWVIQHAKDGYLMINQHDNILYANSHARLFLNLSPEQELSTLKFFDLIGQTYQLEPQEAWASWPKPANDSPGSPQRARYLVRQETMTSEAFWLQVDVLDLPSASSDEEKMIHLSDVTASMKAQRNRWGFHTIICHKLRTPLVGMLGSLEFLVQQVENLSTSEIFEFAQMSLTSVRRLHGEIEDILQYLNAPSLVHSEPFFLAELPSLLREIAQNLAIKTLEIAMNDTVKENWIALSERAVELVFWEVLENSVKFHPIHAPKIRIEIEPEKGQRICLRVSDDGMSLSPRQLSLMWQPYYQGEKYLTGEEEGMGLGLTMVATMLWEVGGICRSYNRTPAPGVVIELSVPLITVEEVRGQRLE
ncbi:signal transduction histidine kinase [Candidatus Moduliflexus flocculans]|uniref:histidine kinase n=1 Tax=Candidatus Moduliflexus flocculans TaxID=1499966 RepID=A0A081BS40_9BACT|nr:signal transduction histidine kinase [Candidatus Moduliflexus flocculans]